MSALGPELEGAEGNHIDGNSEHKSPDEELREEDLIINYNFFYNQQESS